MGWAAGPYERFGQGAGLYIPRPRLGFWSTEQEESGCIRLTWFAAGDYLHKPVEIHKHTDRDELGTENGSCYRGGYHMLATRRHNTD